MLKTAQFIPCLARHFHSSSKMCVRGRRANPGVELRSRLLRDGEKTDLKDFEVDPEFDPDSDFFNVHKSHREHEKELKDLQEKISYWRVRDKYFKVKLPNLLTWAEKENIRYLHGKEPDEWTPEIISENFPIDTEHVKKLLKANWYPKNAQKAQKHDEKVMENWNLLAKKKFKVPQDLYDHLMKFKEKARNAPKGYEERKSLVDGIQLKNTEFLNIIRSSKKYQKEDVPPKIEQKVLQNYYKPQKIAENSEKGRMTVEELNQLLDEDDETLEKEKTSEVLEPLPATTTVHVSNEMVNIDENLLKEISMPPIQEKIKIPKRLWRKGATYKHGDCFYDDTGELLYRVPGMIN